MCNCGHGQHVHVGYVGGCGLCGCAYFRMPGVNFRPRLTDSQKAREDAFNAAEHDVG